MQRRTDIVNRAAKSTTLDLRDWDLDPKVGLTDALDLANAATESDEAETVAFFEALPMHVSDPMIAAPQKEAAKHETNSDGRLLWLGAVMLGVVVISLVIWTVIIQLHLGY